MKRPDRLPEIKAFAKKHGYTALTGSDAFWLIEEVERLRFERDCLAGYAEGLLGLGMSVEDYIASRNGPDTSLDKAPTNAHPEKGDNLK